MPNPAKKRIMPGPQGGTLKGWKQIANFLGHPVAVVQRWSSEGIPVHREGRFVVATPEDLTAWLGKESGKPVHVATEDTDLAAELKRGLSFIRDEKSAKSAKPHPGKVRAR
jgi:hypothetical protein